ncbi:alpha/beta hydrolase family protein [Arthrobacter monumenti]
MMTEPLPILDDAVALSFEYDDVRLAGYAWWAAGAAPAPTVLILHGWGEDASTLAPVARQIRDRGWNAVSISLRGWRGSTGADDYGLSAAKDIGRVLDWIRQRSPSGPTVLLGFSMGGLMAGLAAADHKELTGLVVVGAPCHLPSFYQDTEFDGVRRYFDATLLPEQWYDSSPLSHAHMISIPMLLVTGGKDTMCPPGQGRRMAGAVANGRLFHIPDMEHYPSLGEWQRILDEGAEFIGI